MKKQTRNISYFAGASIFLVILMLSISACDISATGTAAAPTVNAAGDAGMKTLTAAAPTVNAAGDAGMKTLTAAAPTVNAAGDAGMKTLTAAAPTVNAAGDAGMKTVTAIAPTVSAIQTSIAGAGMDPSKLLAALNGVLTGDSWDQTKILVLMTPNGQQQLKAAGGPAQYFGEPKPADSITPDLALPGVSGDNVSFKTTWTYSDHTSKHTITLAPVAGGSGGYLIDSVTKN